MISQEVFLFLNMINNPITGIVIAGGKSSRMHTNKALINYHGIRLIDNAIQVIEDVSSEILVSSNIPIDKISYPIVIDEIPDIGPIGGLYSCLLASRTEQNVIIPCDVPNLNAELYQLLIKNAENVDAVIPRLPNGKVEPLVAFYKKSILPIIKLSIDNKDYKLVNFLSKINVKFIDIEDIRMFKNLNSPEDLL